jgi:SAM-dependent methyltransferase
MLNSELPKSTENIDTKVVTDFGREWNTFGQEKLVGNELQEAADEYFRIFPFYLIDQRSIGFDMGCGSGRWARAIAPRVGLLRCIEPSKLALEQAKQNLAHLSNCVFTCESVSSNSMQDNSQDFGYCLGVLHHVPDTLSGLQSCTAKLKSGAPFLLYLYYRFDNKPVWFRLIWRASDVGRQIISKLPFVVKLPISQLIAICIYYPLAKLSLLVEKTGFKVANLPLSYYRNKSFYTMRTDALDRFGTKLEHRYTKTEIHQMMAQAGLNHIQFNDRPPFWVAVGIKA